VDDQARRGIGKEADSFSPGQEPRRKARPPLTDWLGKAQTAPSGGAVSLGIATISVVTFLWASKEK